VLSASDDPPEVADQFEAAMVWMSDHPMLPGRRYWLKIGTTTVSATVTAIKYQISMNALEQSAVKTLELNEVGIVNIALDHPVAFTPYAENRELGGFILIDRVSNATLGAGMIHFALRRAHNIHWQHLDITREAHAELKGQKPRVLWFTGLSGAGKSTIANLVEKKLHSLGRHTFLLDGDNIRHGLNKDLGFTDADRVENIRRVAETARLFVDAGLIVMVSFISPFRSERRMARDLFGEGEFIEVFVDTPLSLCEARDPKGLYRKARAGLIANFTGIDSAYEPPEQAELTVDTSESSADALAERILAELRRRHIV
jgi:bifunctional enzyme CysN/CysC